MHNIQDLSKLIEQIPSIGKKSAQRIILHLLKNKTKLMYDLSDVLRGVADNTIDCEICGNIDTLSPCNVCRNQQRDRYTICVVAEIIDLWALENTKLFSGYYHVLGGVLSGIHGIGPIDLNLDKLHQRVADLSQQLADEQQEEQQNDPNNDAKTKKLEIIIATPATIEGQTTAYYISDLLSEFNVNITRPAQGIPYGGEIDYLDAGTIRTAFEQRKLFD